MEDCNDSAYVETKRYRYQRDGRTHKRKSYTEWEFWLNGKLICTKHCGYTLFNVNQFITHVRKKYNVTCDIHKFEPLMINLEFTAQWV